MTDQVTWQELAGVIDALDLTPSYSLTTGRAFVIIDGALLWADCRGPLDLSVPGATALQNARVARWTEQTEADAAAEWEAASPERREWITAERRRIANMPDPSAAQMDAALEQRGTR